MPALALDAPTKDSYRLVDFAYSEEFGVHERLTDNGVDVAYVKTGPGHPSTGPYTSEHAMAFSLPAVSGFLDEDPCEIELPLTNAFADRISDGRAHSPIDVVVSEVSESDAGLDEMVHFVGKVSIARRNDKGRAGVVLVEALNWKSRLHVLEGISIDHLCVWSLFGPGCDLARSGFEHPGVLTQISGKAVVIGGLPAVAARYFHRGYVEKDGLRIGIREWVAGTSFQLVRDPPGTWLNGSVIVVAGCDKSHTTCTAKFNRLERIGAFGFATPPYNPLMEVGG